jgi:hypothetical protein
MRRALGKAVLLAGLLAVGLGAVGCVVAPAPHHGGHGHGYRKPVKVVQPYWPAPRPRGFHR